MNLDARSIAAALGGEATKDGVLAPGPGHSPKDRSLSVKLCAVNQDGFIVHSFAGDDAIQCRDYVRQRLGMATWQPNARSDRILRPIRNMVARVTRPDATPSREPMIAATPEAASATPETFPAFTPPGNDGKPYFGDWPAPPVRPDEIRRHDYYCGDALVMINTKWLTNDARVTAWTPWFRVTKGNKIGWQAKRPPGFRYVPYFTRGSDPFAPGDARLLMWCEGEKDADTLAGLSFAAFSFGASTHLPDGIGPYLAGRDVLIFEDNDRAGRKFSANAAAIASTHAASVRVVALPGLGESEDVTDWLKAGHDVGELRAFIESVAEYAAPVEHNGHVRNLEDFGDYPQSATVTSINERRLIVRCAADIHPEAISWFWNQRIAIGKLTLLAGQPGLGKSQITQALAAATTADVPWPCDEGRAPQGQVVVLSAEDDPADTQVPRLLAAGANVKRVHIISAVREKDAKGNRTFNIQADMDLIEREMDRIGNVTLLTIDPLSSYLGKVDSHNNTDVRGVLELLSEMAARRRVAVIGVTHFNKGDGAAINKVIGSIAFVAAARAAWMVAADPDDETRSLFLNIKNNVGRPAPALAYRVLQTQVGEHRDIVAPYILWDPLPVSDTTADQVLSAGRSDDKPTRTEAEDFLRDILAGGPRPSKDIEAEAKEAGLNWRTVRRAQKALGVKAVRRAESGDGLGKAGRWYWELPGTPKMANSSYDGPVSGEAILGESGHLSDREVA